MIVLAVDTTGIQSYIFSSNRLRENIGASYLVECATSLGRHSWAQAALPRPHNVADDGTILTDRCITDGDQGSLALQCEVIYAGGGNIVLLVRDDQRAYQFTRTLSRLLLQNAPGLFVAVGRAHYKSNDADGVLSRQVEAALRDAARQKRAYDPAMELLGLGVTALCRSTRLPATGLTRAVGSDPVAPASSEVLAKLDAVGMARDALRGALPLLAPYAYPVELDHLGRSHGEASYIAVAHADGNGIGMHIQEIADRHTAGTDLDNRAYIDEMRTYSEALRRLTRRAMETVLSRLRDAIEVDEESGDHFIPQRIGKDGGHIVGRIPLKRVPGAADRQDSEDGSPAAAGVTHYLPFRPLVFAGDDVTFVCDGRLGLALAVAYLEQFERAAAMEPAIGDNLSACAGVAIVKTAYPFARAYGLAEDLSRHSKEYRRALGIDGACLDWHVAATGLSGDVEDIRRREYGGTRLTLRPVALDADPLDGFATVRAWPVIRAGIDAFQGAAWRERHNKVKALRDALRSGEPAVRRFRDAYLGGEQLPSLPIMGQPAVADGSYAMTLDPLTSMGEARCAYFDAVELADLFVALPPGAREGIPVRESHNDASSS